MEHWQRVKDLFAAAVDLSPSERARVLDNACNGDTALRSEVERLLDADRKQGEDIISAIESEARTLFAEGVAGTRLGAYRIVGEIGAGGMGAVYLAVRDDDQYQKKVAIKLIRRGMDTQDMLDRFRHERQILANLDHPFIGQLYDGGSSPDGRPFLVMEYVEGEPLDAWCRTRGLDLRERCLLFLKVCEAVSYAHRNLVVHRDLKPGNILVTAGGSPKLLDFGVAKLLHTEAASGRTAGIGTRPMTPDYASPEQVRAEPITTTTDVYSLGAILYELLSGRRAHRLSSYSLPEVERVICEIDPPRLGDVAPALQGDLEAIVSKAMRKEPALRYATVDQLAADLERFLNGWPVVARQGNVTYYARKFVRRNRMAIAAGFLLICALLGGTAAATIQARRAEASRKDAEHQAAEADRQRALAEAQRGQAELQRIAAETQRQIADRRFEQVRQLAGKFLLDFHDAIAQLPGATPARKMTVETGLQYYDMLVREAQGNRTLLQEVARGYDRLGDVQGNPYYANLGDLPGAMASYRKAFDVRSRISDPSAEFLRDRIRGSVKIAQVLSAQGDTQRADRTLKDAVLLTQHHPAAHDYLVRDALSTAYAAQGDLLIRRGEYTKCLEPYSKLLELSVQLAREQRHPPAEQAAIALAHTKLGEALARLERAEEALPHLRTALEIDRQTAAANPNNNAAQRKVLIDHYLLGMLFRVREQLAAPGEAQKLMETGVDIADRLAAADPNNNTALMDIVIARTGLGDWLRHHGRVDTALAHYRRVVEVVERMAAAGPTALANEDARAQAYHRLGAGLMEAGKLDEAMEQYGKAEEHLGRAEKSSPASARFARRHAEIAEGRAEVHKLREDWPAAVAEYVKVIQIAEDLARKDPASDKDQNALPDLYKKLAESYAAAGHRDNAVRAMNASLGGYRKLEQRRRLRAEEEQNRQEAEQKLAQWKKY